MDLSFAAPALGLVAVVCAAATPVPSLQGVPPGQKADCNWSGMNCGTPNAKCLSFEPPPVLCEPGSVGDPDGDGCGCWIPT